jgi:[acyl-carrier-protein] S-malonyltransferase
MHQAALKEPGGMLAVIGLDEAAANEVCAETGVLIANINCPGQIVLSGPKAALAKAAALAESKGAYRVIALQVSGAFHTPLMQSAVDGMSRAIAAASLAQPLVPIVANTTAGKITTVPEIIKELLAQLCNGVLWQRSVEYMVEKGVTTFVEIGPGKVLSGLIRRINKNVGTMNIGDAEAVNNLASVG